MPEPHDVHADRVRRRLRDAVMHGQTTVARVAAEIGITPAAVYAFIADESTVRPYRSTLREYELALSRVDETGAAETPPVPHGTAVVGAVVSPDPVSIGGGTLHPDGSVTLSAQTYGYMIGRLESLAEMARGAVPQMNAAANTASAMAETLSALRGTIERAAGGVAGLGARLQPLTKAEQLARDLEEAKGRGRGPTRNGDASDERPAAGGTG